VAHTPNKEAVSCARTNPAALSGASRQQHQSISIYLSITLTRLTFVERGLQQPGDKGRFVGVTECKESVAGKQADLASAAKQEENSCGEQRLKRAA
jgi:hypothetical protein